MTAYRSGPRAGDRYERITATASISLPSLPDDGDDSPMLIAALRLVSVGLHVFPCAEGEKRPATAHGLLDATRNSTQIRRWWSRRPDCNIGIACEPSGLAVIDTDPPDGRAAWNALTIRHHDGSAPLIARTPRNGRHLYYRSDPVRPLRSTAGQLASHVDSRGCGGYVIAPPSRVNGRAYEWLDGPATDRRRILPVIPAWVLDALDRAPSVRRSAPVAFRSGTGNRYAETALQGEVQAVLDAAAGTRNRVLNTSACKLGSLVGAGLIDGALAEQALIDAGLAAGLGDREVRLTVHSGLTCGAARPRPVVGVA